MSLSPGQFTQSPLRHGCVTVDTTPVNPFVTGGVPAQKGIWLKNPGAAADVPSTTSVFIGGTANVTADVTDPQGGWELEPGQEIFLPLPYLDNIWLVATAATNVCWLVV